MGMSIFDNIIDNKDSKGKMGLEGEKAPVGIRKLRQQRFRANSKPSRYCLNRR